MVNVVTSATLAKIPKEYKRNEISERIPQSTADGATITAMGTIELKIEAGRTGRRTKFYIWNSCAYVLIVGVPFFKTSRSTTFDWENDLIYGAKMPNPICLVFTDLRILIRAIPDRPPWRPIC